MPVYDLFDATADKKRAADLRSPIYSPYLKTVGIRFMRGIVTIKINVAL